MRLQAEFIESEVVRNSIISGVEEMQQMIESVLNFTCEDAQTENVVPVDVSALLQDLTANYKAQGADVVLANQKDMPEGTINTRHLALKRAMRNLVDNALKYGQRAELTLHKSKTNLLITIKDEGDGIPDQALERVFDWHGAIGSAFVVESFWWGCNFRKSQRGAKGSAGPGLYATWGLRCRAIEKYLPLSMLSDEIKDS